MDGAKEKKEQVTGSAGIAKKEGARERGSERERETERERERERELILLLEHQIQSRFLIFLGYHWVISGELPVPKGDK